MTWDCTRHLCGKCKINFKDFLHFQIKRYAFFIVLKLAAVTKTNNYPNPFDYDFCSYCRGSQLKINYVTINLLFSSLKFTNNFLTKI